MSVIEYPWVTEKAMNQMDFDNKLQFVVDLDAHTCTSGALDSSTKPCISRWLRRLWAPIR